MEMAADDSFQLERLAGLLERVLAPAETSFDATTFAAELTTLKTCSNILRTEGGVCRVLAVKHRRGNRKRGGKSGDLATDVDMRAFSDALQSLLVDHIIMMLFAARPSSANMPDAKENTIGKILG